MQEVLPDARTAAGQGAARRRGRLRRRLVSTGRRSGRACRRPTARLPRSDARARALRRGGLAPSPDHFDEREAADPGRRHTDPVPGARGDRRGRHHRGRHRHRRRRARGPCGGRRRLRVGPRRDVHPAGSAARHRARRDDRGRRSWPASRSCSTSATTCCSAGSAGSSRSSSGATPTRTSCSPTCASPSTSASRCSRAIGSFASSRSRREPLSDLALVGVYLFRDSILEACHTLEPSGRGEYEITEAIQWLLDEGREVRAEMVSGYWKDTGRPEDLLEANRMMLASLEASIEGEVDDATDDRRIGGRARRAPRSPAACCAARSSSGRARPSSVRRVGPDVSIGRAAVSRAARWSTRSSWKSARSPTCAGSPARSSGGASRCATPAAIGAHRLIVGDQSRIEVD